MYVWFVRVFDEDQMIDQSEPFISPAKAMSDIEFRHLDWKHIPTIKFSGTVLEHWQAEYQGREYVLDKEYVIGSEDEQ